MKVLVYTELRDGKFKKAALEQLAYARALQNTPQGNVDVAAFQKPEAGELERIGKFGADSFVYMKLNTETSDAMFLIKALQKVATNYDVILFASTVAGRTLGPGLAALLNCGLVTGVTGLPLTKDPFVVPKFAFTGKAIAHVQMNTPQKVLLISGNAIPVKEYGNSATMVEVQAEPSAEIKTRILDRKQAASKLLLTEADVVISGGRGMKGPEQWKPLEELASELGGALACSRPVSDEGWRSHSEHVGQTGKIISPNLYIACGISGAIQHVAGVSGAKVIVAINKDPEAPIFETADYGIIGDVHKVLPDLVAAIKKHKSAG
ncbi:MAG: electron transfer flavoprotein subunit alpha/FixB family protein [Bacteroidales bacterium]|nr:electron transfer flavoprotein subunit alpha/FixB family protein [Bacteroidales bacterium]